MNCANTLFPKQETNSINSKMDVTKNLKMEQLIVKQKAVEENCAFTGIERNPSIVVTFLCLVQKLRIINLISAVAVSYNKNLINPFPKLVHLKSLRFRYHLQPDFLGILLTKVIHLQGSVAIVLYTLSLCLMCTTLLWISDDISSGVQPYLHYRESPLVLHLLTTLTASW